MQIMKTSLQAHPHQNIRYTQNRFKQVNLTLKNYVHVVHVVIVPLLSLYQYHCFC